MTSISKWKMATAAVLVAGMVLAGMSVDANAATATSNAPTSMCSQHMASVSGHQMNTQPNTQHCNMMR
ncbi:hypothetical protein [Roseibium sp. RKSG952]|uniref:hypothetical protein n=1 Tax=Roseibium sp. RKSG952 TaxID=2529384 RepID=UPI0012BC9D95|nr:hypothetical protein [Roseibium sp. RKSG952]MTH98366.1 hypothetical protein [Roseibium sp. RKSG952]